MPNTAFLFVFACCLFGTNLLSVKAAGTPIAVAYIQDYFTGYAESDSVCAFLVNGSNGQISSCDILNAHAQNITIANLTKYQAILVGGDSPWADSELLSDALATYLENGGGIVVAFYASSGSCSGQFFSGRFQSQYTIFTQTACHGNSLKQASVQTVEFPKHPTIESVANFTGDGFWAPQANSTLASGSYVIAYWTSNRPMIVVKDNVGPKGVSRVDLGFWPDRDTLYYQSEIQDIERNALLYVAGVTQYAPLVSATGCTVPNVTASVASYLATGETVTQSPTAGTPITTANVTVTVTITNQQKTEHITRTTEVTCPPSSEASSLTSLLSYLW